MNKKLVFIFNKFFYDLIKDVKEVAPELKSKIKTHYKVKNMETEENLDLFRASTLENAVLESVLQVNATDILELGNVQKVQIMTDITVNEVLTYVKADYKPVLSSFFLIFLLFSLEPVEADETLFDTCVDALRDMQNDKGCDKLEDIIDDDIKVILQGIDKVIVKKQVVEEAPSFMHNSKIGSIAKEITDELDISSLNIQKPEDLLDFKNNNVIGDIVSKVGSKLQEKFDNKELSHEELLREAMGMLGNLGAGNSMLNNPLMKEMMKAGAAAQGTKGAKVRMDTSKLNSMAARERLRKKLDERNKTKDSTSQ